MTKKIEEAILLSAIMGAGFVGVSIGTCTFWSPRPSKRDADVGDIVEKIFK